MPKGYTKTQIILHWAVVLLVAAQYIFGDFMSEAFRQWMREGTGGPTPFTVGHVVGGILILVLVVWRMAIKAKRGAPPLPADEPPVLQLVANLTHLGLYALLILMVFSGGIAWFAGLSLAAQAHEILKALLMILIVLHVAAALWHHFIKKSDVMRRMVRPE